MLQVGRTETGACVFEKSGYMRQFLLPMFDDLPGKRLRMI